MCKRKQILSGGYAFGRLLMAALMCCFGLMLFSCSEDDDQQDYLLPSPLGEGAGVRPFQWTRAEDVETRAQFLRNFGVGYSYDAVRGSYCDWSDIRCQVLNRAELEMQEKRGRKMLVSQNTEYFETKQQLRYSQRDYAASLDLRTSEKINLGLYNKEKRTRQYVLEEGLQDCFYFMAQDYIVKGEQYLLVSEVMDAVNEEWDAVDYSSLLTRSFQDAIEHLAWSDPSNYAARCS